MRRAIIALLLLGLWFTPTAFSQDGPGPEHAWGFEGDKPGRAPADWFVPGTACDATVTAGESTEGEFAVLLTRRAAGFANFMRMIDAAPFRGKRIRLSAGVRYLGADGRAQMWLRADRPDQQQGFFDNMSDRPITDGAWKTYEIIGEIEKDAEQLALGFMFFGPGPTGVDDVRITILPDAPKADVPPAAMTARGLMNVTAFARLLGYVRHFCPTDAARAVDWNGFAIAGVERVEGLDSAEALAKTLEELFVPIAPGVTVSLGPPTSAYAAPEGATRWVSYRHTGYAQQAAKDQPYQIYAAAVERESLDLDDAVRRGTKPGTVAVAELGDGVIARVPIGTYADGDRSLPVAAGQIAAPARPEGWRPTGDDRSTRLAAIILAWNVFEHFYPYFDVVETDWPGVLRDGLLAAATDADRNAFQETLERLGSALHDGHVWVNGPLSKRLGVPLLLTWVGDQLVVEANADPKAAAGVLPGDVIVEIDGESTGEVYARLASRISGATDQWKRYRGASVILNSDKPEPVMLTVRHPDGASATIRLKRGPVAPIKPHRPENGAELAPGVRYFNLDGAEDAELAKWLPTLAKAPGVVLDLRGYPGGAGAGVLPHLTDQKMQSARWNIPVYLMPRREGVTFEVSNWDMQPKKPRFEGRVVFITDGRAISYAESCMGIVEAYKLGEIVGGATAGTNGNVIGFELPGRYSISFTGMKVVKHDGTAHHGRGIFPTVPAAPTLEGLAAGKDEVLERAVQVAGEPK